MLGKGGGKSTLGRSAPARVAWTPAGLGLPRMACEQRVKKCMPHGGGRDEQGLAHQQIVKLELVTHVAWMATTSLLPLMFEVAVHGFAFAHFVISNLRI